MGSRFAGGRGGGLAAATNASAKTNAAASGAEDSEDEDDFVDASDMMDDDDDFLSPESKFIKFHQTHIFCHLASTDDVTREGSMPSLALMSEKKLEHILVKTQADHSKTQYFANQN